MVKQGLKVSTRRWGPQWNNTCAGNRFILLDQVLNAVGVRYLVLFYADGLATIVKSTTVSEYHRLKGTGEQVKRELRSALAYDSSCQEAKTFIVLTIISFFFFIFATHSNFTPRVCLIYFPLSLFSFPSSSINSALNTNLNHLSAKG